MAAIYTTYDLIDKKKWDRCVQNSANALIYAESVYLDHMAHHWDGIIWDDYDFVMPIPWKRKMGVRYIYQPAFIQQGGIFGKKIIQEVMLQEAMNICFEHFPFAEGTLNFGNDAEGITAPLQKKNLRKNYILQLDAGYEKIAAAFHSDVKQTLRKPIMQQLQYQHSTNFTKTIRLYLKLYGERFQLTAKDRKAFELLCENYVGINRLIVREVVSLKENKFLGAVLLLKDNNRLYNMISCITPEGKKKLANYFLYNSLIREFAGGELIFDFEGSDLPGVAFFYSKFTKTSQPYHFYNFNRLPAPLKWLKK